MSFASKGLTAVGRLLALGVVAAAFFLGMAGVVYMSLQGSEVKVPEITGKSLNDSEKDLAMLGLKIKKRADRPSTEAPGTVIEQLPKPGETVKTGQMILVVTSKGPENGVTPAPIKTDEDDTEKIEEMISDKPKKPKANSNTSKKKPDTTRDVNTAAGESNSSSPAANSNRSESPASNSSEKPKPSSSPGVKAPNTPAKTVDSKLNKRQ